MIYAALLLALFLSIAEHWLALAFAAYLGYRLYPVYTNLLWRWRERAADRATPTDRL